MDCEWLLPSRGGVATPHGRRCPICAPLPQQYSTGNNFYLNRIDFKPAGQLLPGQANVTDDQFNTLVFEHVKELWTSFGALMEIW